MIFIFFLQLIALIVFLILARRTLLSLFSSTYLIYMFLVGIPFYAIYFGVDSLFIFDIFGRSLGDKTTLALTSDLHVLLISLISQYAYLIGGFIAISRGFSIRVLNSIQPSRLALKRLLTFSILIGFICLFYLLLREYFVQDFPLFHLLKGNTGESLRDIAFNHGSKKTSYIFLPSINRQFYRIGLPLSALLSVFIYQQPSINARGIKRKAFASALFFGCLSLVFNLGTFKRTPIIYLIVFILVYTCFYKKFSLSFSTLIKTLLFLFAVLSVPLLFTYAYTQEFASAFLNLLYRVLIGESIGEYLALSHFGETFQIDPWLIYPSYLMKVLGFDSITFSELWKQLVGGSRGYTSVGIFTEMYISFGYLYILPVAAYGFFVSVLDSSFVNFSGTQFRPVISILITTLAFASVKGLFSQFFTGGALTCLVLFYIQSRALGTTRSP